MGPDSINIIVKDSTVPDDWLKSVIVNMYKGKEGSWTRAWELHWPETM